jgi:protein-disulfide isomerase
MSDFECPFCKRFADETFPTIEREFINTGKVRWVYVHFPIPQLHPNAVAAAELASCAARQDKFWPVHDRLFATQEEWAALKDPAPFFLTMAKALRVNEAQLTRCLQSGEGRREVQSDAAGAVKAGASSTPSFYIEGGMMSGAHPIEVFRPILDSIVKVKSAKK